MGVKAEKRRHSHIRWIFILLFLIVVLIGVILGVSYTKLGKINSTPMNQSKLVTVHEDANMKDYTNIALFGIDSQTGSMSDRGNRSDSIIVVSINNQTKEIKMLSIYRDTYVSVNGHYTKINAAYSMGGPELAVSTINRNLDLNITQYATVNFKILADIVDSIGGIEVKVDSSILKNLNSYIGDMNRLNGGDSPKIKTGGVQTLAASGVRACRLVIDSGQILMKNIEIPMMKKREIKDVVKHALSDIDSSYEDLLYDYSVLSTRLENKRNKAEILCCGMERKLLASYVEVFEIGRAHV